MSDSSPNAPGRHPAQPTDDAGTRPQAAPAVGLSPPTAAVQRGWQTLVSQLTVREDPEQPDASRLRLSALGHAVLTGSIFLAGVLGFIASTAFTQNTMHRWDLCGHTEDTLQTKLSIHSRSKDMAAADINGQAAITSLNGATPSQRSRLREQRKEIIDIMGSYCMISHNFQVQFTAFTVVGTAAAILVTISLASVAPDGLKSRNRTLLNVLMSASIVLAICVIYPQAFSQRSNLAEAQSIYMQAANLLRSFSSAIANQQVATSGQNPAKFSLLNSSANVAIFIRSIDNALDQLTASRLSMNNDFADRTLNQLTPTGGTSADPSMGNTSSAAGTGTSP